MANFINLMDEAAFQFSIKADTLSVLFEGRLSKMDGDDDLFAIYHVDNNRDNIFTRDLSKQRSMDDFVAELAQQGKAFIALDCSRADLKQRYLINLDQIDAVITSEPSDKKSAALIYVNGCSHLIETGPLPLETLDSFVQTLKAHKPNLYSIDGKIAPSRFYETQCTMFDPTSIKYIDCLGGDVNVHLRSGGRLDIHPHFKGDDDYLNSLYQRVIAKYTHEGMKEKGFTLNELDRRAKLREKRKQDNLMRSIADGIADEAPQLLSIHDAQPPVYLNLDDIAAIQRHDNRLTLTFNSKSSDSFSDELCASYPDEETAKQEIARIQKLVP